LLQVSLYSDNDYDSHTIPVLVINEDNVIFLSHQRRRNRESNDGYGVMAVVVFNSPRRAPRYSRRCIYDINVVVNLSPSLYSWEQRRATTSTCRCWAHVQWQAIRPTVVDFDDVHVGLTMNVVEWRQSTSGVWWPSLLASSVNDGSLVWPSLFECPCIQICVKPFEKTQVYA